MGCALWISSLAGCADVPADATDEVSASSEALRVRVERRAIARTLEAVDGNRKEAAAQLGIGLRTLYDKLKRYGLS